MEKEKFWLIETPLWAIPLWVTWPDSSEIAQVEIAPVPLTKMMRQAASDFLDSIARGSGPWFMQHALLEHIAHPLPDGADPEEFVSWTRRSGVVKVEPEAEAEFYQQLVATGYVKNTAMAVVLWTVIQRHLFNWLVNWRRPVDLGFCELTPVPFRQDWKQQLLWVMWRKYRRTNMQQLKDVPHFFRSLMKAELVAWVKKQGIFLWTIEVRHLKPWWEAVIEAEVARKALAPPIVYLRSFLDYVKDNVRHIHRIWSAYAAEKGKPTLEFPEFVFERQRKTTPHRIKLSREVPSAAPLHPHRDAPVAFDDRTGQGVESVPLTLVETDEVLSAMRDLQPPEEDVREPGEVVAPDGPAVGDEGLRVLAAPGGEVPPEKLLGV